MDKVSEFLYNIYFCFIYYVKVFDCVKHSKLDISVFWETCMLVKKQQLEPDMGRMNWFKIWESSMSRLYIVILLFNLYAEYIMWNAGLNDSQAAIKTAERNTNNFRYANDTTLMAESKEEQKSLLMKVKKESEKS